LKEKEVHLINKVSKELGLTYKELGEKIGYSESNLRKSVSENRLSLPLKRAVELYIKVLNFQQKEEEINRLKDSLRTNLTKIISEIPK
jgi:hypothetical protein